MTVRLTLSYLLMTALCVGAAFAQQALSTVPQQPSGEVTATGTVKVDGKKIGSGFSISAGAKTSTAKGSSAVVSLGKLGRVEIMESSTANISFDDSSIKVALESGRVRISSSSGVSASVSTKDGEVVANDSHEAVFTVDTRCGNTIVAAEAGRVELRAGGTVKQIAAGSQDTAGTAKPGLCKRRTT
jgi:ferric-dicitrate binding protein FerR (iron transport regulator)